VNIHGYDLFSVVMKTIEGSNQIQTMRCQVDTENMENIDTGSNSDSNTISNTNSSQSEDCVGIPVYIEASEYCRILVVCFTGN